MAAINGYTPEQASDLYIADGTVIDWMWNTYGIFSYTIEMYPGSSGSGGGFYPPDEQIVPQTTRNRDVVLLFSEYADCVYRVVGLQGTYCGGGGGGTTIYSDNFDGTQSWTVNPNANDTATTGQWQQANPADTNSSGAKQLGTTVSGSQDLVTGASAGTAAGDFDIDGGTTSVRSPSITLPSSGTLTLNYQYYFAFGSNSSSADFFRVSVVTSSGTTQLFNRAGAATDTDAVWTAGSVNLTPYAGQSVQILIQAADASTASLVEAGVDNVTITQS
jgi:hypothetical protein